MWFNNILVYQCEIDTSLNLQELLAPDALHGCPPHARFIYGWLPVIEESYVHQAMDATFVVLGKEERLLPRGVITRILAERINALEMQQGRTVTRSEKAQMGEELEFELLPKAFCLQKRMPALIDTHSKSLFIHAASYNQAAQMLAFLRKSIPGIRLEPLACTDNLPARFASWITDPTRLNAPFQLASDCLLFAFDNEKKRINCKGYELPADEIGELLTQGFGAAEISLIWNERIQFTLTHELVFKRMKSLDYLVDAEEEINALDDPMQQLDAQLVLLSGELRALTQDLLKMLSTQSDTTPVVEETISLGVPAWESSAAVNTAEHCT